jgi:hypothetical protein
MLHLALGFVGLGEAEAKLGRIRAYRVKPIVEFVEAVLQDYMPLEAAHATLARCHPEWPAVCCHEVAAYHVLA